jgi:hypothetical protein
VGVDTVCACATGFTALGSCTNPVSATTDAACTTDDGFTASKHTSTSGTCVGQLCSAEDSSFKTDEHCATAASSNQCTDSTCAAKVKYNENAGPCQEATCTQIECCKMWPGA